MSHVRCVCSSHMSLPGRLALSVSLCRSSGLTVVTVAGVPRASCCRCRRTTERATTVMLSRPACVDRGISCVGPVGRGRRASACVEGPVRGRGPRSTDNDRRDPRRALWSPAPRLRTTKRSRRRRSARRAARRYAVAGDPASRRRPARRGPGRRRRRGACGGEMSRASGTSPLDVTTSAMAPVSRALTA